QANPGRRGEERSGERRGESRAPKPLRLDLDAAEIGEVGHEPALTVDGALNLALEPGRDFHDAPAALKGAPAARPATAAGDRTRPVGETPAERTLLPATVAPDTFHDKIAAERWLRSTFDLSDSQLWDSYLQLDAPRREALRRLVAA